MVLRFSLSESQGDEITGYDLGHMEIRNETKLITSANRKPNQAMMIFLSIISLLDGIRKFTKKKSKSFKFVAADSSFSINFVKNKKSGIVVSIGNEFEEIISESDLIKCIYDACSQFYNKWGKQLPDSDPVKEDMEMALSDFRDLI